MKIRSTITRCSHCQCLFLLGLTVILSGASPASAQLPVTGYPVPELSDIDDAAAAFMTAESITAGLIGVMKDGVVIYQRGFGWNDSSATLPVQDNALVRIASCTKPFTAAAFRKLIDASGGLISTSSYVYDLGQSPPGLLDIAPFGGTAGQWHEEVTVEHCLRHQAGWDRVDDPSGVLPYSDCDLVSWMGSGYSSPVSIDDKISWLLSRDLYFQPGTSTEYASEGFQVLGRIIEVVSGLDLVTYHRRHVLTPGMWVPATDLYLGRALEGEQELREPWYDSDGLMRVCNYDRTEGSVTYPACDPANLVPICYGALEMEGRVGSGSLVASASTMLELARRYIVKCYSESIGLPQTDPPTPGGHGGETNGRSAYLVTRSSDTTNVFIFFNRHDPDGHFALDFYTDELEDILDAVTTWPTMPVDGFWVDPDAILPGYFGSYDHPFAELTEALDNLEDGSKVNILPGTSDWTGTISTKLLLRAPLGTARIGDGS